jgi:hypothetical protein
MDSRDDRSKQEIEIKMISLITCVSLAAKGPNIVVEVPKCMCTGLLRPIPLHLRRLRHLRALRIAGSGRKHILHTATMAATRYCPSCLTKASPTTLFRSASRTVAPAPFLRPFHTSSPLAAVQSANAAKYKRKDQQTTASKKKKKSSTNYATPDLRDALQFSLVDAMR